ncbi:MAG: serine hydrolase domain-containing protein, partial [Planctomycetota bacterium]
MSLLSPPRLRVACKPFPVWDVTTRSAAEVAPAKVGLTAEAVAAIWRAVERYYETGLSPAIALCLRREGEVVIDRAIGHAHGNGPSDDAATPKVLATPKTPFVVFSTSKAITATLIHLLDERGQLRLDDRVCEFIPEFGLHQKEWITIRHLLTHRAGIPMIAGVEVDLDLLSHHERVLEILCAAKPVWRPGQRLAYHALSGGFVLGEVIRRITSAPLNDLITEAIRKPLGLETLTYGIPIERAGEVASSYFTGL